MTPIVGREQELAFLLDRWHRACAGDGQVVLLSGEPGIGKSRLIAAMVERLAPSPTARLRYFCSPYHVNSALHPVTTQVERAAGLDRDDSADVKLDKLEALLARDRSGRRGSDSAAGDAAVDRHGWPIPVHQAAAVRAKGPYFCRPRPTNRGAGSA